MIWTKHGEWSPHSGPCYLSDVPGVGRFLISGEWGTTGDNMLGWRKTRGYRAFVVRDGVHAEIGYGGSAFLKTAKNNVERWLASRQPAG
jgi:hypothetical protein